MDKPAILSGCCISGTKLKIILWYSFVAVDFSSKFGLSGGLGQRRCLCHRSLTAWASCSGNEEMAMGEREGEREREREREREFIRNGIPLVLAGTGYGIRDT